jgi:hypothetical protein
MHGLGVAWSWLLQAMMIVLLSASRRPIRSVSPFPLWGERERFLSALHKPEMLHRPMGPIRRISWQRSRTWGQQSI